MDGTLRPISFYAHCIFTIMKNKNKILCIASKNLNIFLKNLELKGKIIKIFEFLKNFRVKRENHRNL